MFIEVNDLRSSFTVSLNVYIDDLNTVYSQGVSKL